MRCSVMYTFCLSEAGVRAWLAAIAGSDQTPTQVAPNADFRNLHMTENVTFLLEGEAGQRGAEHVFWTSPDGSREKIAPEAVLRCRLLRELVDLHGNATLPFCTPDVKAWQAAGSAGPHTVTTLCSALRVWSSRLTIARTT